MRIGKVSGSVYERSVKKQFQTAGGNGENSAGIRDDCAVFPSAPGRAACSLNTVTFGGTDAGALAVINAVNHLAAAGAGTDALQLTALLPSDYEETALRELMHRTREQCDSLHIPMTAVHSNVSDAVRRPAVTAAAIGSFREPSGPDTVCPVKALPGQELVLSKWIGLEGTTVLAKSGRRELAARYPVRLIEQAAAFDRLLSIAVEAAAALKSGVRAMHDVSEGGLFGALWEFAEQAGVGLEIEGKSIPVRQETIEVCEFYDLDPYALHSGGSLLMAADNGRELVRRLAQENIPAAVIGRVTQTNDRVVINDGDKRFLEPSVPDELLKMI